MQRLFTCANRVIRECDWRDMALIKFCLCSLGVLIGLCVPEKKRKFPLILAAIVFAATYIPLMLKIVPAFCRLWREEEI